MKEVACAVCGAVYRFAAAEIPPTGKTVTCAKCKARVVVPPQDLPLAGGTGDVIDLADLPAPRGRAGVPVVPPAGAGRVETVDLPAPKGPRPAVRPAAPSATIDLPAPKGPPRTREPEPMTLDSIDLVAPVGPVSRAAAPPPSVPGAPIELPGAAALFDNLPAPKGPAKKPAPVLPPRPAVPPVPLIPPIPTTTMPGVPVPAPPGPPPIVDLLAPRPVELTDLPAPKRPPDVADLPAPKAIPALTDLPAPKRAVRAASELFDDLPAPRTPAPIDLPAPRAAGADLPAPRAAAAPADLLAPKLPGPTDLPAPKRGSMPDVPAPKRPSAEDEFARPGHTVDLPAPKGFFDDLPGPVSAQAPQLPAPKGFFDDFPGPANRDATLDLPAPKGFFDDLPQPATGGGTDVAPKGFFDDLPQPATGGGTDVAPKGFFDDLPRPASGGGAGTDVAPKGFFADLPQPALAQTPQAPAPSRADRFGASSTPAVSQPGIALDGLGLELPGGTSGTFELQSNADGARAASRPSEPPPPLELLGDGDPLGLELPATAANAGGAAAARGVVSFKPSVGGTAPTATRAGAALPGDELDLAVPSRRDTPSTRSARAAKEATPAKPRMSSRAVRIALFAVLALAAVGAGGFVMYSRWQARKERAAEIDRSLKTARKQLAASERGHWKKATRTANELLQRAPKHPEALGIAAQGALAGYLDEGGREDDNRPAAGRRYLDQATSAGLRHPALDKGGALRDLVEGDAAAAITALQPLAARGDTDAQLYLGWAQLAAQQWAAAQASFNAAKTTRPVPALFGLAQAQAGAGDTAAAHASYLAVIALDPEHVAALVGEAVTAPGTDVTRREAALLAILQRRGIENADPRAVVQAWTRAGDDARRAGRLDAARERYRKALAILPGDRATLVSAAALELADGELELATDATAKALALAPDDAAANLIAAELDLRRGKVADAAQRLSALRQRQPPLAGAELLGRLELLDGMRLEAEHNHNAALAAYDRATAVPGNTDVAPTIAAATLLGRMADDAEQAKPPQPQQAKELRAQADARLATIAGGAESDPNVAITLGVAYLSAGAPAQAEKWLRAAIEKRPSAVEAQYQLAEALRRQGKQDEAVATLVKAFELDPTRIDLGVELARGFEAAHRDSDAAALYKRLLAGKDVTADVRARAGRFFARTGDITAARQQGELLLTANPEDPVGMFLKGEGLLADGRPLEARRFMIEAANHDPDAQLFDGLGRATEAVAAQTGDTAMRDEALRAYDQAADRDPTMLNPQLGAGRIHLARAEYEKALASYQVALRIAPRNPDIPYGIGIAYAELDDRSRAIEWLARAVAAQPRADAYWRLGSLYYEIDRAGAAADALGHATSLATKDEREHGVTVPWLTDALWLLGTVQQVLHNDRATVAAWDAYLARNPSNKAQVDEVRRMLLPLKNR